MSNLAPVRPPIVDAAEEARENRLRVFSNNLQWLSIALLLLAIATVVFQWQGWSVASARASDIDAIVMLGLAMVMLLANVILNAYRNNWTRMILCFCFMLGCSSIMHGAISGLL